MSDIYKNLLKELKNTEYTFDKKIIDNHCVDWRGKYKGSTDIIFFPKSVSSVIKIVKFCFKKNIPIVPQGGNTSLVGGSVPRLNKGEIIINLCKLNKIREIDTISNTVTVESGCILENINDKLDIHNLQMPISLGSKGSCQIGGNIATNAGGLNYIKFGSIRSNILGIEAILPNGEFYNDLKTVKKNNTGLDLKQLFIGSEGTLGIITAATLQIYKKTNDRVVIIVCMEKFKQVLSTYQIFMSSFGDFITAFELMNKFSVDLTEKLNSPLKLPFKGNYYCLVELTNFVEIEDFNSFVFSKFEKLTITDMDLIIAKSENENKNFWQIREEIPLAEKFLKNVIQHDVSLPLNNIESFINKSSESLKKYNTDISIINFGHLGDNNLHFNVCIDKDLSKKEYENFKNKVNKIIFSYVKKLKGSISAEHGIGQLRKEELIHYKSPEEIKRMKKIKNIFDPKNIMNPGKVI